MARILIVDDDRDGRDALCQYLQRFGYEVECVADGRDALAAVLARTPDLIVLDMFMPQMDGGGLLEILRSYLRLRSLPVIVWTAFPEDPAAQRALSHGVAAVLQKGKATFADINQIISDELSRAQRQHA